MTVNEQNNKDNLLQESCVGSFWVIDNDQVIGEARSLALADNEDRKKGLPDKTDAEHHFLP